MRRLLVPAAILVLAGLVTVSSVAPDIFYVQLLWVALGVGLVALFYWTDLGTSIQNDWFVWGLYGFSVALLFAALFFGPEVRGTRSWIVAGPVRFQPVELAKIALIFVFAHYFSRRHLLIGRFKYVATSFVLFVVPAGITLLLPDLGSALVLGVIWFGSLLVSGLPRKWIISAAVLFAVVALVGWVYFLADYQKERIAGVFYPERDVLGINYSTLQSKIAIGSGGWLGKGYGQGTEVQLGFLPEAETDFVFSALVEEWGLVGGFIVLGAYMGLLWQVLKAGMHARANFDGFLALGAAMMWGAHFVINIGSAIGLAPVIGIPLSFVSYGGSHMVASFFLLGAVVTIRRRSG